MEEKKKFWQIWYNNIAWFICELVATFSNKPSYFASKRLERFALFVLAYSIIIGYVKRHWGDMTLEHVLMLFTALVLNSAWNGVQIRKDLKELPKDPINAEK